MSNELSASDFAWLYRERGMPMNPSLMTNVFYTDVSTSVLVWEEGQFLVEMYLMHPNAIVVEHSHPFENCILFVNGAMKGEREGALGESRWLTEADRGLIGMLLPPGQWHKFQVGANGCVFFNVSKWYDINGKTSATKKYFGQPLGPIHAEQLKQ